MISHFRKAIMKRSRLKNKANKSGKPADKTAYKTPRNLVVKLNKEAKGPKNLSKNQITENATNKTKHFCKLCKPFFTGKAFHYKQKFALKTERGITSSETKIANIFNNYFVNITFFLLIYLTFTVIKYTVSVHR